MHPKKMILADIIIFAVILILHVFRLIYQLPAMIGGVSISIWASYLAVIILLVLIYINYQSLKKVKVK